MATAQLPSLPAIERLSPRIIRVLGGNPGKFSLQGTNTYLVGQGPKRILIDTGHGMAIWAETIKKVLSKESVSVDRVLLTHWHPDHVSGVKDLLALCPEAKVYKNTPDPGQLAIEDGQIFETEGVNLRALHCPGHTTDHMAFILAEEDAMFTGDNVLGHGTAVFEDLATYTHSLERMQTQFEGRAYPGHGAVIENGPAKVKEYINHRRQREQDALKVLGGRNAEDGGEFWGSMQIVKVVYKDYPESLHGPAEGSLVQVLRKLEGEGRVRKDGEGRWAVVEEKATL